MKRFLMIAVVALTFVAATSGCDAKQASRSAIKQSFPDQYSKALAVATCESGLDPSAVSPGGGNWGLFQINRIHAARVVAMGYQWSQITNPVVNARVARSIYNESGWRAWSCG